MGYYIECDVNIGKVDEMIKKFGAKVIKVPDSFKDIPEDQALLCVVTNPFWDAVGYCYDDREFSRMNSIMDLRAKTWMTMDKNLAQKLCGYEKE